MPTSTNCIFFEGWWSPGAKHSLSISNIHQQRDAAWRRTHYYAIAGQLYLRGCLKTCCGCHSGVADWLGDQLAFTTSTAQGVSLRMRSEVLPSNTRSRPVRPMATGNNEVRIFSYRKILVIGIEDIKVTVIAEHKDPKSSAPVAERFYIIVYSYFRIYRYSDV
jgi:hypothetical protein